MKVREQWKQVVEINNESKQQKCMTKVNNKHEKNEPPTTMEQEEKNDKSWRGRNMFILKEWKRRRSFCANNLAVLPSPSNLKPI
jgi:hypothetical protein